MISFKRLLPNNVVRGSLIVAGLVFFMTACMPLAIHAQQQEQQWNTQEQPIFDQIKTLRSLPDDVRAKTTKDIALEIRALPASTGKLKLAVYLASRATEGDFGHDTLQEVTTTLAGAVQQAPPEDKPTTSNTAYSELAELARYEHMQVSLDSPQYKAAMAKLEADDQKRQSADFTLTDLQGKTWTLKDMKGKVVLVNFWATWCPPCRKEIPDLDSLYASFHKQGFVVLGISDEEAGKVAPFVKEHNVSYPILLDAGRRVNELFAVQGIPKSFLYDRQGKIVATAIDMRTRQQFLEMLAKAGLQ
jgi:peroxiredoxin